MSQQNEQYKTRDFFSYGFSIVLQVRNKKAALLLNNKTVFETLYKFPLKSIYGLRISFAGIGLIENLEIKDYSATTSRTF